MKKKLIIVVFSLLLMIGFAGTLWGASIAEAASSLWNSCQRGEVNCVYPGKCRLYIDTNGDSICDRSQPDPKLSSSVAASAGSPKVSSSLVTANAGNPSAAVSTAQKVMTDTVTSGTENTSAAVKYESYYFFPILAVLGLLYGMTWILSARRTIKNVQHRKIWNMVLLVSTVISALLGLFLILSIDFNINITLPFNMLFWHVEAGIALGIVAVFHIIWHWRYFAKMVRVSD